MRKILLLATGILSIALATAGLLLPLLPTTPFLLLAAACFLRSSEKLHCWLVGNRWFGPYIRDYREHGAVSRRAKWVTLFILWATLGYTILWIVRMPLLRILLLLIGIGVTIHVLRLRTRHQADKLNSIDQS